MMNMDITCYRDREIARQPGSLPAGIYNLARTLLMRSETGVAFVPIRSMQYMAILDAEEFVFVDGQSKSRIDIAWQHFRPQARTSLQDPVPYEAVFYASEQQALQRRLLSEFPQALRELESRREPGSPVKVLKFEKKPSD